MHVVIAIVYGFTIWLATLAYMAITGCPVMPFVLAGPLVISGAVAALIGLDALLARLVR